MMKYSTPTGIKKLEKQIKGFAETALGDVRQMVELRVTHALNQSEPAIENALHKAAHQAGKEVGRVIGKALATPLAQELEKPITQAVDGLAHNKKLSDELGPKLSKEVA